MLQQKKNTIWSYIFASGLLALSTIMTTSGPRLSISADIYDANDTALQFIVVLPFVIWKFISSNGIKKILSAIISLLLLIGIISTQSRGGFLGLVAVMAVTMYQMGKLKNGKWKMLLTVLS